MTMPDPSTPVEKPELSRHPATAWVMLTIALPLGGWLLYEIHRTIGLDSPRLWELLRTDRVFDVAMLDFVLTSGWAFLVLIERSSWNDWRLWVTAAVYFAIPTLGIIVFILLHRQKHGARKPITGGLGGNDGVLLPSNEVGRTLR